MLAAGPAGHHRISAICAALGGNGRLAATGAECRGPPCQQCIPRPCDWRCAPRPAGASQVERELLLVRTVNHPNVCRGLGCFEDEDAVYIVQEICARGDLLDFAAAFRNRCMPNQLAARARAHGPLQPRTRAPPPHGAAPATWTIPASDRSA